MCIIPQKQGKLPIVIGTSVVYYTECEKRQMFKKWMLKKEAVT